MVEPIIDTATTLSDNLFPVVGVGASAGGLEAFKQLLKAIPENSGIAYILVQHLDPFHQSILPAILQRTTKIPVSEITDNLTVLPDHIYIIPANKILKATDGILTLHERPSKPEKNMPIDVFFRSLAEVHQDHAIGVVLSGNGTDGTLGVRAIKEHGGITFAQPPPLANSDAMPLSAIQSGKVDFVLTPDLIPAKLYELGCSIKSPNFIPRAANKKITTTAKNQPDNIIKKEDFQKIADDILLSDYTPQGVVVNDQFDIVQFRGSTGAFLEQPPGRPTINIMEMAREGLGFELRNALHQARKSKEPVTKTGIPVENGDLIVTIEVIPLLNTIDVHFLILFLSISGGRKRQPFTDKTTISENGSVEFTQVEQLQYELAQSRKDMHDITKAQAAANDELQSANEELLSGSEELQSVNEELETSREEIQSALAELVIVNRELFELNEQYDNERQYSEAIVETVRHPLLVLTKDLRVKSANKSFYKFFNVNTIETEGKLLYELGNGQWNIPALNSKLGNILNDKSIEDFEVSQQFPGIGEKTMLLNGRQMFKENSGEPLILLAIEDITVKKALEVKEQEFAGILLKERRLLHDFFMQTPAFLCILRGPEHIFELVNPLYLELIGNRPVLGKPIMEALPEMKGQEFALLLDKVYYTGESFAGKEMPINIDRGKGIESVYLNFNYKALIGKKGETEGILIFAYDVTEQIIARRKVEASAAFLQNMYMNAPAFICTVRGPQYIYDLVNPSYQALFDGRSLLGRPMLEALPELPAQHYKKILDTVYSTGETFLGKEFPILLARKDGAAPELRHFNFTNQPLYDEDEQINGIFTFGYEVTDEIEGRKILAEITAERMSMLEAIPQCAWTAAVNGDLTYANKFFYDYTGLVESETLIWGWTKVVAPNQAEEMYKKYKKLITAGKDFELEFLMKRNRDDAYRWHLLRALAICDPGGAVISWVGTSTDIHDQKLFAEVLENQVAERTRSLKIANEELGHSNQNLEQFAYVASHDLQEPLRKIQIFSSMLGEQFREMPEKAKELLEKIHLSTERMTVLIKDVLNFSKLTLTAFTFEKTNLNGILKDMIGEFDMLIQQKHAVITVEDLPVIEAIPLQMRQLFYNLISNALKFSLIGRDPRIDISCKMILQEALIKNPKLNPELSYCEIIFKDNGIGFDQQFAEKIFLIFQRLHSRQMYVGTGIGLALCQNIAINHGGEIYAKAVENKGAAFHILLPVSHPRHNTASPAAI